MLNRRKAFSLLGQKIGEAGILILVFVPLDLVLQPGRLNALGVILGIVCGLMLVGTGIFIEASQWTRTR